MSEFNSICSQNATMTSWLPFFAFALSLVSITLSIASFTRDRAKLIARSEVRWSAEGPDGDFTHPTMIVRLVNLGRRPIVLVDFEAKSNTRSWTWRISDSDGFEQKADLPLEHRHLAQHAAVRLAEGEVAEVIFQRSDATAFIWHHEEPVEYATRLFVVGCSGHRYQVKGSDKTLKTLLDSWDKRIR